MSRAKSQELKKRQRQDTAAVTASLERKDRRGDDYVRLGLCPPQNIDLYNTCRKQQSYDSRSKNVPTWYNRTGPGQYEPIDMSKLSMKESGGKSVRINPLAMMS